MRRPNFFIVGAPKCGTTSLSEYLRSHPNVFMSSPKEPHFFATDLFTKNPEGLDTVAEYLRLFADAEDQHQIVGEASATYMFSEVAIPSLHEFAAAARIVVVLRNPVDMVYSLHSQFVFDLFEPVVDFDQAWQLQDRRKNHRDIPSNCPAPKLLQYRQVASFADQLERLYAHCAESRVLVLLLDEFKSDPQSCYGKVLRFLTLPIDDRREFPIVNERKELRVRWMRRIDQRTPIRAKAAVRKAKKFLGLGRRQILLPLYSRPSQTKVMPAATRRELVEVFHDDICRLSSMLGRDLGHWLRSG